MNNISKEILEKYQIRKNKKQKTEFIEFLRAHFPELAVEEGGFGKNRNLVIGNISSAKAVLGAHYDTCAVMPVPNFIMPKRPVLSVLYSLIIVAIFVLICGAFGAAVGIAVKDEYIATRSAMLLYWVLLILLFLGPANKHTVNDNTSGVITLVELMSSMTEEERAQYCFVFFDNEEKGLLGSSFFAKQHKEEMEDKLLINFDCVSDGDNIMFIANKKAYPEYAEKLGTAFAEAEGKTVLIENEKGTHYPSDQRNFKKNIAVAALKKGRIGLYMDRIHTPRDTVMDEKNIELLKSGIKKFLEQI